MWPVLLVDVCLMAQNYKDCTVTQMRKKFTKHQCVDGQCCTDTVIITSQLCTLFHSVPLLK